MSAVVMAGGRVLGSGGNILAIAPGGNQPVSTQQIKWPNGHWLMTENYESGTNTGSGGPGQMASEVALLKASPDMVGYIPCMVASTVEDYTQSSNIALTAGGLTGAALQAKINQQYSGLATWESWFYYQQSQVPGSLSGLIINFVIANGPTGVTGSTNFSTHPAVVPNDVRDCAGSITVPNSYGSTSTTTYQVAPIYTGSPYYGFGFANSNGGTTYAFTVPAYWNPGVNQRQRTQLWQAFYQRTFTYGPAYVATTAYTPGQVVTWTDGNSYLCIANTTGNAPPNATYWLFNRWAGKTPDAVPEFARAKTNDEVTWNCAQNASTGTVVSPPNQGSTSYPATNAAFWAAHGNNAIAVRAAGPTTRYEDCISFGFTGSDGAQSVAGMQYVVNHLFPGNAALGLSRIRGWVLSDADVMANNFNLGAPGNGWFDPYGIWSYTGALGMSSGDQWSTSGFTYYSTQFPKVSPYALSGLIGWDGEVQAGDYAIVPHGSSGITANTQSIIIPIIDNCRFAGCDTMTWSPTDNTFSGSVWASYIYPGIVASLSAHALSTVMPAYYFYGPTIVSITGATSTTLTINWAAITGQGTGLSILLYRNGTQIASGTASSFITYTDTGLTPSTQYTYTLAMQNANGTGPQGAAFQGTTSSAIGINGQWWANNSVWQSKIPAGAFSSPMSNSAAIMNYYQNAASTGYPNITAAFNCADSTYTGYLIVAPAAQATTSWSWTYNGSWTFPTIPATGAIATDIVNAYNYFGGGSGADSSPVVFSTDQQTFYNLYSNSALTQGGNGPVPIVTAAPFPIGGGGWWNNAIFTTLSAGSAAGACYLGGIVRPSEWAAGVINHALMGAYPLDLSGGNSNSPDYAQAFIFPARSSDAGGPQGATNSLPEGARLQLDPSLTDAYLTGTLGVPSAMLPICHALQTYGWYNMDIQGDFPIQIKFISNLGGANQYPGAANLPLALMSHMAWIQGPYLIGPSGFATGVAALNATGQFSYTTNYGSADGLVHVGDLMTIYATYLYGGSHGTGTITGWNSAVGGGSTYQVSAVGAGTFTLQLIGGGTLTTSNGTINAYFTTNTALDNVASAEATGYLT